MRLHTIICANSRPDYLKTVLESLEKHHPDLDPLIVNDDQHLGMAANVQKGFDAVLATDADYALWIEDDMEILSTMPLDNAMAALDDRPLVAQCCFRREPFWGNPAEMRHGDQLAAICEQSTSWSYDGTLTTQDFIFSLNPCIIPRRILELGWPAGELGIGNETGMTNKLLALGYTFGSWGEPGDGQVFARHIGTTRGPDWKL